MYPTLDASISLTMPGSEAGGVKKQEAGRCPTHTYLESAQMAGDLGDPGPAWPQPADFLQRNWVGTGHQNSKCYHAHILPRGLQREGHVSSQGHRPSSCRLGAFQSLDSVSICRKSRACLPSARVGAGPLGSTTHCCQPLGHSGQDPVFPPSSMP